MKQQQIFFTVQRFASSWHIWSLVHLQAPSAEIAWWQLELSNGTKIAIKEDDQYVQIFNERP